MALFVKKGERILHLPPEAIRPNPDQPRAAFDPQALQELTDSIRLHGILQPLSVRREPDGSYTLVAGERRLRAAKMAGLTLVPCLPVDFPQEDSALLALVENLQRCDLNCWEEAAALRRLIQTYGLSQEQVARKIGKSQSAVANKLRLLNLSPALISLLRTHQLTERHARALLRLPEAQRLDALQTIIRRSLNVAATDRYIDSLLQPAPQKAKKPAIFIRDVRLFLNTVSRGVAALNQSGLDAQWKQEDTGDSICLTIRIPKGSTTRRHAG